MCPLLPFLSRQKGDLAPVVIFPTASYPQPRNIYPVILALKSQPWHAPVYISFH